MEGCETSGGAMSADEVRGVVREELRTALQPSLEDRVRALEYRANRPQPEPEIPIRYVTMMWAGAAAYLILLYLIYSGKINLG